MLNTVKLTKTVSDILETDVDEKYYYKYQNDVPAQTQHFITIYSSQPLTAQNIKIDWGDETVIDLYQKTFDDLSEDELLKLAGSAEKASEHPLGEAIVRACEERNVEFYKFHSFNHWSLQI